MILCQPLVLLDLDGFESGCEHFHWLAEATQNRCIAHSVTADIVIFAFV